VPFFNTRFYRLKKILNQISAFSTQLAICFFDDAIRSKIGKKIAFKPLFCLGKRIVAGRPKRCLPRFPLTLPMPVNLEFFYCSVSLTKKPLIIDE
jgi:hypothetical protein